MFHYISGQLAVLKPNFAVIEAGGVGYKLTVSGQTHTTLTGVAKDEPVRLYTYLAVREDGIELFGFHSEAELDMFSLLITVQGVGPRAALSLLSSFTPDRLILAVCTDDRKAISKANGIGPKTATRIILELHDKLANGAFDAPEIGTFPVPAALSSEAGGKLKEAEEALTVLGYSRPEIAKAFSGLDTSAIGTEDIIRAALKKLMK